MQDYDAICKHVGKMVIDFNFTMEKMQNQYRTATEEFKKTLDEKNERIRKLEEEVEKLRKK